MIEDESKEVKYRRETLEEKHLDVIGKMYLGMDAPDYLVEDQPGESNIPCKPLIQKVKDDINGDDNDVKD